MRPSEAEAILDAVTAQGYDVEGQEYTVADLKRQLSALAVEIQFGRVEYKPIGEVLCD